MNSTVGFQKQLCISRILRFNERERKTIKRKKRMNRKLPNLAVFFVKPRKKGRSKGGPKRTFSDSEVV